jgi:hypothetical protein
LDPENIFRNKYCATEKADTTQQHIHIQRFGIGDVFPEGLCRIRFRKLVVVFTDQ